MSGWRLPGRLQRLGGSPTAVGASGDRPGLVRRPSPAADAHVSSPGPRTTDPRHWLATLLVLQVVVGTALAFRYRLELSPDATAYVDIARAYAAGRGWEAVDGLWSPLYSWLLVVPLLAGADPLLAGQLIQVLAGAGALAGTWGLLGRLGVTGVGRTVTATSLGVVLLSWSVGGVGPDILPVLVTVWFVRLLLDAGESRPALSVACGLLAGLGYLAKASFLPFFVLLTLAVLALRVGRSSTWQPHLVRACAAASGFAAVALPWAAVLTLKYHHPTLGTSAAYNLAIIGPGFDSLDVLHPQDTAGLLAPPGPWATSVWTDPVAMPLPRWSPLSSTGLPHEARNVALNLAASGNWLARFWLLAPFVLLWSMVSSWRRPYDDAHDDVRVLTVAALVLGGIYLPWLVESRYLWPAFVLVTVLGAHGWTRGHRSGRPSPRAVAVLAAGALLVVAQPLHHLASTDPGPGRQLAKTALELHALGVGGRIASMPSESWTRDLVLSYHLGARYYGTLSPTDPAAEHDQQLRSDDIDFVLGRAGATQEQLSGYTVLATLPDADLVVLQARAR